LLAFNSLLACAHKVLATHPGTAPRFQLKKGEQEMDREAWKTVGRGLFVSFT